MQKQKFENNNNTKTCKTLRNTFNKRWLDGNSDGMDMNLSSLQELDTDREAESAAVHAVGKSWTWLSDWTELNWTVLLL